MLTADYFDGCSTRVQVVSLNTEGAKLVIRGDDVNVDVPWDKVKVDERLGRAPRRLRFGDGSFCSVKDLNALDALLALSGHRDGWVDRMQRHGKFVLVCIAACVVLAVAGFVWLLPWAVATAAAKITPVLSHRMSVQALQVLDGQILLPSKIPADRQQTLNARFQAFRAPAGGIADIKILFRNSPQLGANAFTMPDGTMVVLDDLITAIDDDRQILAVFAHEAGHAHAHHGLQLLLRSSVVGAFLAFYVGDISSLLAVAPATLMQASYSRDLENEADDYAATLLSINGMSPRLLAEALKKLTASHPAVQMGYLSTHPNPVERIRRLNDRSG